MSQYYFSVDVETSSTNPFFGELLTIGIVAIDAQSLRNLSEIYIPFKYSGIAYDPLTMEWWQDRQQVSKAAYDAAWEYENDRFGLEEGAHLISEFVNSFGQSSKDRIFTANPVSFDYPWVAKLYSEVELEIPFHYRTLCMRSLYFGLSDAQIYGESRAATGEFHDSRVPHHALEDARAQALDLILMLSKKQRSFRVATNYASVD